MATDTELSPSQVQSLASLAAAQDPAMPAAVPTSRAIPTPSPTVGPRRVTGLTVVIPAKDEARGLPATLDSLNRVIPELSPVQVEVLVVDDGSTDDTAALARSKGARVISHPESLGNGAAIKHGIREAQQPWVMLFDADGQHPPEEIPALLDMAERYDLVVASRGGGGGDLHRNLANKVYNWLASYVTNRRIPDLTSGFRVVRADIAKGLVYLLPNTFSYPTTMTLTMIRNGHSVGFHPFQVRKREGKSHIKIIRDGSRFLLIILRIATMVAPLRVFLPLALATGALGVIWYLVTYLATGRFTNMAVLLMTQAMVLFALGLISEQVSALRYERMESGK